MGWRIFLAGLAAIFVLSGADGHAAQLTSLGVKESGSLPRVKPGWPVPRDPNQVFFIQRSINENTVVYSASFDGNGNLRKDAPAKVYWRRYTEGGRALNLKPIERRLAFGLSHKARSTPGEFTVSLRALPNMPMVLRQTAPGKAQLLVNIGGRTVEAEYAFVTVDESGLIPKVTKLQLFGRDPNSGRALAETFRVKGGLLQ